MKAILLLGVMATASSALGAYTVDSRFSEVKRVNWNQLEGTTTSMLGTTTSLGAFNVGTYQISSTNAAGATYSGRTTASGTVGPPAGSNHLGSYETSHFEMVFTITTASNFTLSGSLQRYFFATSVLKLEGLTAGTSATRTANATGSPDNDFAADLVNWSGTLLAGQYRLSIDERGNEVHAGEWAQGTKSSFTFSIPAPGASTACALAGLIATRRRR